MCGIAGIFDEVHCLENQNHIFRQMIQSMKHRGPNDEGLYMDEHVALMHTRLSIVDLECGKQPMQIGKHIIVYNGECYNTDELRNQLIDEGAIFHTKSDTEVILMSYLYYKEKCLDYINGIFAFAIYDIEHQEMFLARDPMGVKPLFYTLVDKTLLFANEMKTLFAHPLVRPVLDIHGIHQIAYLGPGRIQGSGVFKNIYELKGGEYGVYSSSSFHIHSYFKLNDTQHIDDYDTTVKQVTKLVVDSVERQLISDVPLGCFLSGGLDSSIIVAIAANAYKKQNKILPTFSLEFENNDEYFSPNYYQPSSDIPYINMMVNTFQTKHTKIKLNNKDLMDALYKAVDARDLPGMADIDTSLLCFCEKVKKHVDVVLSGECADEIFGGYPWFKDGIVNHFPWTKNIDYRNSLLNEKYQIDYKTYIQELCHSSIHKAPLNIEDSKEDMLNKQMTYLNMNWFMKTLLDRKDRMSMASGLEARVPFCDKNIIQYVYSIPKSYKSINSQEKGILREAMKDILPQEILERKKNPFPKTHHPEYLKMLRIELLKLRNHEPIWKIFNRHEVFQLCSIESEIPWYGQLMTTPQTIAYFLQINYWLKKYKIIIE